MTTKHAEMKVPPATPAGNIELVPVRSLLKSPTQPRTIFDAKAMEDLTASVREHGIVQPLLARPLGMGKINGGPEEPLWEIISGERRWRAAESLEMTHVPCLVRELTNEQAMEIQTIENLQRVDLHPMEEARGYQRLMEACHLTVDEIAAKTGKSKTYIYGRMRLCALVPEAEKFFLEGKLDVSTAFLVSRIPAKLQPKAAEELSGVKDKYDPTPMGVRQAREHIERNYMLRLADASFDVKCATLVSAAGACSTCPKRTGNDKDLFGDIKGADICTDPPCFREKQKQHIIILKMTAKDSGLTVLPDDEAKKIFKWGYMDSSQYVDLDATCHEDPKLRTYKRVLGKRAEPVIAVVEGKVHSLMTKDRMAEALKAAGVKARPDTTSKENAKYEEQRKRELERRKLMEVVMPRLAVEIGKKAVKMPALKFSRWSLLKIIEMFDYDDRLSAAAMRLFPKEDEVGALTALDKLVPKLDQAGCISLMAEILCKVHDAKTFKVDVGAIEKTVKAELKAAAEKAKAPAPAEAGKPAADDKKKGAGK